MIGNLFRAALFHGLLAAATGIGATANAQIKIDGCFMKGMS